MRGLLLTLALMAVGGFGGLLLMFFVGAIFFGPSHTGVFNTFFLSIAGSVAGAVGLPVYSYRRRIRNSRPWEW
jgi:hypothetical protein